jgi:hypothetical protein
MIQVLPVVGDSYCQELPVSLCWMSMTRKLDGSLAQEMESSTGTSMSRMSCHLVVTNMMANACTTARLIMQLNGWIDNACMMDHCVQIRHDCENKNWKLDTWLYKLKWPQKLQHIDWDWLLALVDCSLVNSQVGGKAMCKFVVSKVNQCQIDHRAENRDMQRVALTNDPFVIKRIGQEEFWYCNITRCKCCWEIMTRPCWVLKFS